MELLAAALSMAVRDAISTLLVLAETKNRAIAAGALDALNDLATILVTVFGAGEVIVHGWGLKSIEIVVVMMLTSFIGTVFWTRMGHKLLKERAGMSQAITVQDLTGGLLTETEFNRLINGLQLQAKQYNASPWVTQGYSSAIGDIIRGAAGVGTWHIELLATSDQEGAIGYHEDQAYQSTSHSSRGLAAGAQTPLAKIFVQTAREAGVPPSEVASHELLEMMVDPLVTEESEIRKYLDVQSGKYYIAEVGDPVQGEGYDAGNGAIVANFAYPGWWNQPQGRVTIWDYRGTRKAAFELAPGGYISVQSGPNAPWEQIYGEGAAPVVQPPEEVPPEEPRPEKEAEEEAVAEPGSEPESECSCQEEVAALKTRIEELEALAKASKGA